MKAVKPLFIFSILTSLMFLSSCFKNLDVRDFEDEEQELADYIIENEITTTPTWTGLYYIEELEGSGEDINYYDTVTFEYEVCLLDGTEIGSSDDLDEDFSVTVWDYAVITGLNEALCLMKNGGKARVIIPSTLAYGGITYASIPAYSTLIYDLEVINVSKGISVEPYSTEGITEETTSSGLSYYKIETTDSTEVVAGETVTVHYTGYLENGEIFYSSVKKGETEDFSVGTGSLLSGFDEGLQLMKIGEKFRLVIPPDLAYGETGGFPLIPPDNTLTFDVELIDIP